MQADSAQQQGLYRPEFDHDACGIGALADINGERHHQILDDALSILVNLEHRGGTGLEKNTGDGAGILFQVPHHFFRKEAQKCGQILPAEGDYGVAMLFFPQDDKGVEDARRVFEEGCAEAGVPLLFWREVPVDPHDLGETARACMPTILQAFLGRPDDTPAGDAFERRLYVCRRTIEKKADAEFALRDKIFYVCSMSSRTIVYKGMLVATQMRRFFIDLNDAAVKTAVALVHSRYSTNTTPSWERAHPNRFIIHNGEINTLKGNVNWIRAREPNLYSPVLQHDLERVMPIINREGSDSAILDNVLEFLVMNGRPLTRAASMLLPEPWDHNDSLSEERPTLCANPAVDALAGHYDHEAHSLGVPVDWRLELPRQLAIPEADFCMMLGNLLENAFHASQKLPPEQRQVKVMARMLSPAMLGLLVENRYDGVLKRQQGTLHSTKHDGMGIGLVSIQTAVSRYGGSMTVETENCLFRVNILLNL